MWVKRKIDAALGRIWPEKQMFLRSNSATRFLRLSPSSQAAIVFGCAALIGWTIIATGIVMMDSIGAGSYRDVAQREQEIYRERLNTLASERDISLQNALSAQQRFNSALAHVSQMQSTLLALEQRNRELEHSIEVAQTTLNDALEERVELYQTLARLEDETSEDAPGNLNRDEITQTLAYLGTTLADTAQERDQRTIDAATAHEAAEAIETEMRIMEERNNQIFRQLEEAMMVSIRPIDQMFSSVGINTDNLINQVRRAYSGQGGPLEPISFPLPESSKLDPVVERANYILTDLDRINLYRIAVESTPFDRPLKVKSRFTSGFGPRWGRMHNGADFAAAIGSPILATADGVVSFAGWQTHYGRIVIIKHEFGLETRYAHMSKIRVKRGQKVSRGERIGDIGSTGRSTGPHLHYEIRVNGKPVNPMNFIKAARDVL